MRPVWGMSLGSKENYSASRVCAPFLFRVTILLTNPSVRGIGTSLATATNWGANLLINSTYLTLMGAITPAGAFGFYAGLCFLGCTFVVFCYPETAGLTLEEVKEVFQYGFGVRES